MSHPVKVASDALYELLGCLCTKVAEAAENQNIAPLCICSVAEGDVVAWDYCGSCDGEGCGQAFVQLLSITPSPGANNYPGCAPALQASYAVGILRCATIFDGRQLPSADDHLEVSVAQMTDAQIAYDAVLCCDSDFTVSAYEPVGPQGGCVGGRWTVTLEL